MLKVTLFLVAAATFVGCASTREKTAAEIQSELPQLVAACNGAFRDGREQGLGIVPVSQGIEACDRLALGSALDHVNPATADLYRRYSADRTSCQALSATVVAAFGTAPSPCDPSTPGKWVGFGQTHVWP